MEVQPAQVPVAVVVHQFMNEEYLVSLFDLDHFSFVEVAKTAD